MVTRNDVQDFLGDLGWQFSLDGATLGTTAPPLRPLVPDEGTRADIESLLEEDFGGDVILGHGFGLQRGRIMAPDELAVGQHTLRVILTVTSDVPDHVHLHGYDLMQDVGPGMPARIAFRATRPGTVEAELEDAGVQIARITAQ